MDATKMRPFLFEGEQLIRVVDRDGHGWFVAAHVCKALALSNPSEAVKPLDEDEKTTLTLTEGGPDRVIISEGGLYTLILRSRDATKPGTVAHRFRRWVTDEVLPSIRKTGRYEQAAPISETDEVESPDGLKLRKVNTAVKCFGERAGAQLWSKLGLDIVPAMRPLLDQLDLLKIQTVSVARVFNG